MAILDWVKELQLSPVLKERLVDTEKQISSLEQKITDFESKIHILEQEKIELSSQLKQCQEYTRTLENKITGSETETIYNIDQNKISILKMLFSVKNMATEQIAQKINSQIQFAEFHLEELQKLKMVKAVKIPKQETGASSSITIITTYYEVDGYQIEQEGRKYLIDNNLSV